MFSVSTNSTQLTTFYLLTYTGHTQNNGAVLIVLTITTAPFFCVCPVYFNEYRTCNCFPQWLDNPLGAKAASFFEASKSHSDTPHSVGLLWTSDQLVAETST